MSKVEHISYQGGMSPLIILENRKQRIEVYRLPAAVGRNGEEADIYLFDESISRIHCRFDIYKSNIIVTDLYSTMGTIIEKTQLEPGRPYFIEDGSKIKIGKRKFKIRINHQAIMARQQDAVRQSNEQSYDNNIVQEPENDPEQSTEFRAFQNEKYDYDSEITEPLIRETQADTGEEKTEVLSFSRAEDRFRFPARKLVSLSTGEIACIIDKTPFFIGRKEEDNDVVLDVKGVSRRHMYFEKTDDSFYVTDLESTNGVLINGEKIPAAQAVKIEQGDKIKIGEEEYCFEEQQ